MRIVQTSEPAHEPLLLEEVKSYLRIDGDHEDAAIAGLVAVSRALIESKTGLNLIDRNIDIYADTWLDLMPQNSASTDIAHNANTLVPGTSAVPAFIQLSVRPVSSITTIALIDTAGGEAEWPASNYMLQPGIEPTLRLVSGASWPTISRVHDAIKISVTSGFAPDWNAVPELIQQAIIKVATNLYISRGDNDMPEANLLKASGAESLLHSFRKVRL